MIFVTLPEGMPSISWVVQGHFLAMFYKFVLAPNMSFPLSSASEDLQLSASAQGTACGLHFFSLQLPPSSPYFQSPFVLLICSLHVYTVLSKACQC